MPRTVSDTDMVNRINELPIADRIEALYMLDNLIRAAEYGRLAEGRIRLHFNIALANSPDPLVQALAWVHGSRRADPRVADSPQN